MGLTKETCGPCHGEGAALTGEEVKAMMREIKGWELTTDGRAIHRQYKFKNFATALAFTNRLGALAEAEGHHPDLTLGWGYVGVTLTTHHFNALTRNDFILAAKINAL